jgi:hypothetical protein
MVVGERPRYSYKTGADNLFRELLNLLLAVSAVLLLLFNLILEGTKLAELANRDD